jgi:nucleosome binding factor SPN SPT16 subunit
LFFQVEHLTKNFGFVMGIEFREGTLSIAPNCDAKATKGMIFNVNIGLSGTEASFLQQEFAPRC